MMKSNIPPNTKVILEAENKTITYCTEQHSNFITSTYTFNFIWIYNYANCCEHQ